MAQSSPRFCSECGSPIDGDHRFCTNCGASTSIETNNPTALATGDQGAFASDAVKSSPSLTSTVPTSSPNVLSSTMITPKSDAPGPTVIAPAPLQATSDAPAVDRGPNTPPNVLGSTYSTVPSAGTGEQLHEQATDVDIIPPPPPPDSFISTPQQTPSSPYYTPPTPGYTTVPAYAQAPKRSRGCLIASIVLLLVLALGGVGAYFVFFRNTGTNNSSRSGNGASGQQSTPSGSGTTAVSSNNTPSGSGTTQSGNGGTPTTSGPATEQLNLKFTYSSIDITVTSVQEASSFPDDSSASSGGIRVSIKDSNPTTKNANYLYGDVVRLVLPDGSTVAPVNEQNFEGPAPGISRDNWIDFAVTNQNIDLSKLVLLVGATSENQISIPLNSSADLSKYQPKAISPNTPFQYAGMSWTITSATKSLSANGQQAKSGQVFIVVTLKAVNSSGQDFNAYPGDYIRVKSGDTTSAPSDFTFPLSVASQSTGTGTVTFSMPEGSTSFTLMMLARQSSPPINQVTANFQIQ